MFQIFSSDWVACFKVVMLFVFALCGLIVFMVYLATTYSERFQTSKMGYFCENSYLQWDKLLA